MDKYIGIDRLQLTSNTSTKSYNVLSRSKNKVNSSKYAHYKIYTSIANYVIHWIYHSSLDTKEVNAFISPSIFNKNTIKFTYSSLDNNSICIKAPLSFVTP